MNALPHAPPRGHRAAMTDTSIAAIEPTRQAIEARTRSKPGRVTGKLAEAITLMVETGARWDDAAQQVGLTARTMRLALDRPHVIAFLRARKQVFREAASTANIKRLCEIRDAANNMPAVQAIKLLEQIPDENASSARGIQPGFVVQILNVQSPAVMERDGGNDAKPLIQHEDVRNG